MNVSPECDCWNHNDAAIVPDLGILASADPVALDKACADMVIQAPILHGNNCLATAHEHDDLCGCDKFHLMHPDTDWLAGLRHAEVGHEGGIVVVPAVAFGRYVHDEADVEMGLAHNDSEGIFRNLVVQTLGGIFGSHHGTVVLAEGYALSATYAFGVVYFCLAAGIEVHGVVCAMLHADVAAYAVFYVNLGLRGAVQFQLSAYAGTSHAQILQGAAETGFSCPLK